MCKIYNAVRKVQALETERERERERERMTERKRERERKKKVGLQPFLVICKNLLIILKINGFISCILISGAKVFLIAIILSSVTDTGQTLKAQTSVARSHLSVLGQYPHTSSTQNTPDMFTFIQGVFFNAVGIKYSPAYLLSNVVDLFRGFGSEPSLFDQVLT
jgi:hypothetical protein